MRQPHPDAAHHRSPLLWPLIGDHGLRGGWRVLGFAALFIAGSELLEAWWPHSAGIGDLLAVPLLGREAALLLIVLASTLILGRMEGRSLGAYGLPIRWDTRAVRGLALGFAAASGLILALTALRVLQISIVGVPPGVIIGDALEWGLVFLVVALFEELLLRGYMQATLARSIGFWPSAILLSVLFALAHARNAGETPLGLLAVGGFGLFFCYTLRVTGNLWLAVGFHAAWDWSQSFFYGVPDSGVHTAGHFLNSVATGPAWLSGGSVGPEGSVLVFATLGGASLLIGSRARHTEWAPRAA